MARQYSHKQFFRHVPNALLKQYFQKKHKVLKEVYFDSLKGVNIEPIFEGFKALPAELQETIEAELQDIDNMACQLGVAALIDGANSHGNEAFPEAIAKIEGFHGKIMWVFLNHPKYWPVATLFLHSDNISGSFWKKRNDLPHHTPKVNSEDTDRLADAISDYFNKKEGRGRNCKVEVFRRHDKEYFFAYPEDFAQSGVEWVRNKFTNKARHPAFEIIFVYAQAEGSLDIYAPRNTRSVPKLQQIFADTILGLNELDEFSRDNRVYNLDALKDRDFAFKYPADCGIEYVVVKKLRLSLKTGNKERIIVEADPGPDKKVIYDLIEELQLPPFYVTQTEIKVKFNPTPDTKSRTRSFKISYPDSCALRHDGRDLIIRKMLIDSGLEPVVLKTNESENENPA